jgi:hypothetical protein
MYATSAIKMTELLEKQTIANQKLWNCWKSNQHQINGIKVFIIIDLVA